MSMRKAVGRAMAVLAGTALCMAPAMNAYAKDDNVSITVTGPEGWVSERGEVKVAVEIKPDSGVEIKSIEARQGNGKWSDITESLTYMATDNGKVQIRVKDVEGKSYEEELELTCFDKEQPTLIAAVNEGVLHIQAQDGVSGIRNVYVNGYTFENVPDGDLTIRLQQFDATYAVFVIQVTDQAGNISDVYTVANPYATEDDELVHFLPTTAIPSDAETAVGTVTEYSTPEVAISGDLMFEEIREYQMGQVDEDGEPLPLGKEIYTIETVSGKTFYMVIDKESDENNAYLLTQAGEADILNFLQTDEEKVLPQNAAVVSEHVLTVGSKPG
ncbi:MAG: DUF4366 domain-containing protein, partial [Lachnospiraceae bacterium]|nr:DUF4366 domain-containing protein [Lachnospiraceae bacterium]